jgi:hypothetical protein
MGGWIDVAGYLAGGRHVDLERVLTVLQIQQLHELPPPPRWRPGAPVAEMMRWRGRIFDQLYSGRFLPQLVDLTCRIVDSLPHAVVEGEILGTSLRDSSLTHALRSRYAAVPCLRLTGVRGGDGICVAVNGRRLDHDGLLAALGRRADGGIDVDPEVGLSWSGAGQSEPAEPLPAPRQPAGAAGRWA